MIASQFLLFFFPFSFHFNLCDTHTFVFHCLLSGFSSFSCLLAFLFSFPSFPRYYFLNSFFSCRCLPSLLSRFRHAPFCNSVYCVYLFSFISFGIPSCVLFTFVASIYPVFCCSKQTLTPFQLSLSTMLYVPFYLLTSLLYAPALNSILSYAP